MSSNNVIWDREESYQGQRCEKSKCYLNAYALLVNS